MAIDVNASVESDAVAKDFLPEKAVVATVRSDSDPWFRTRRITIYFSFDYINTFAPISPRNSVVCAVKI